jgi:hypothetical protein
VLREEPQPLADHDGVDMEDELIDEVAFEEPAQLRSRTADSTSPPRT